MPISPNLLESTADIVCAFVSKNHIRPGELPELISSVQASLMRAAEPAQAEGPAPVLRPAVPIKNSVTNDYIVSLEDGRRFKALKRHLTALGMTPNDYKAKWSLPPNYPMVAHNYRNMRAEQAKRIGLGHSRWPQTQAAELLGQTVLAPLGIKEVDTQDATSAPVIDKMQPELIADDVAVMGAMIEQQPARRRGRPKKAAM